MGETSEFDRYVAAYDAMHRANIARFGEGPDYFADYKVREARRVAGSAPRILDFGAGIGNSIESFGRHFPEAALTCADVSGDSLAYAERRHPGAARMLRIGGERLALPDASVDLAFAACVFHHIAAAEHPVWLAELLRVTRPGGRLALFEHNPWNPLTVRAVRTCPFDENAVLIAPPAMRARVRAAGWAAVATRFHVFFPRALSALRPLEPRLGWCGIGAQYAVWAIRP